MNRFTLTAFDDRLQSSGATATVVTSTEYGVALGMFDQLAFVATAEQISGSNAKLSVTLSHSADGRNWLLKPGTLNIPATDLDPLDPNGNMFLGFDDGIIPSLRLVRFVIQLTGVGPLNAAVRLEVTANDVREGRFAVKMRKELQTLADANQCAYVIQGGSHVDPEQVTGYYGYGPDAASAQAMTEAAVATEVEQGRGPLAGYLRTDGDGYRLADDARLCVGVDGTVTISNTKGGIQVASPTSGGSSGGTPGSSTC